MSFIRVSASATVTLAETGSGAHLGTTRPGCASTPGVMSRTNASLANLITLFDYLQIFQNGSDSLKYPDPMFTENTKIKGLSSTEASHGQLRAERMT